MDYSAARMAGTPTASLVVGVLGGEAVELGAGLHVALDEIDAVVVGRRARP